MTSSSHIHTEHAKDFLTVIEDIPLQDLFLEVRKKVDVFLPRRWIAIVDRTVFRLVYISAQNNISIQRKVDISANVKTELYVHCHDFVDRVVTIMNNFRKMEICSGYDELKYQPAWTSCPYGEIDRNPYQELDIQKLLGLFLS